MPIFTEQRKNEKAIKGLENGVFERSAYYLRKGAFGEMARSLKKEKQR